LAAGVAEVAGTSGPFGQGGQIVFGGGTLSQSTTNQTDYSARFSQAAGQPYSIATVGATSAVTWATSLNSTGASLSKVSGTGLLTLTGNNSFTGGVNINSGTLNVGSAGALGSTGTITFGGGTLQYSAANQVDYSSRLSTADGQAYRVDPNGQTVVWASNLVSNGGSLAVTGTTGGALDLQGNNSGLVAASGGAAVTQGTAVTGGPTIIVHNPNSLGVGQFRANGGRASGRRAGRFWKQREPLNRGGRLDANSR
jgi:autotransporter-associated beta strand protein